MSRKSKSSGLTPAGAKVNDGSLKPAGKRQPPQPVPRILGGVRPGVSLSRAGAAVRHPEQNAEPPE